MISRSEIKEAHTKHGHFYEYDGHTIPSVNTYLDVIRIQTLEDWKLKRETAFVQDVAADLYNHTKRTKSLSPVNFKLHLNTRIKTMRRLQNKQDRRTEMGTLIHTAVECLCRQMMGEDVSIPSPPDDFYEKDHFNAALNGFRAWVAEVDFRPLDVEAYVVHFPLLYAGQIDLKGYVRDRVTIIDIKTGSRLYGRHHVQVSNYLHADQWMRQEPFAEKGMILKLGRNQHEASFEAVDVEDDPGHLSILQQCKAIYQWRGSE